jgi:hypothetical protein
VTLNIGSYSLTEVDYDRDGDVLYLGERGIGDRNTTKGHVRMYPPTTRAPRAAGVFVAAAPVYHFPGGRPVARQQWASDRVASRERLGVVVHVLVRDPDGSTLMVVETR